MAWEIRSSPAAFLTALLGVTFRGVDGFLIRREGGAFFLRETEEQLDELSGSGPEELLMSEGGRFFLRIKHEEYFDGKQWLPESRATKLKHPRRNVCQAREITHAAAIRWLLDNSIPSQMWEDFSPQSPKDTNSGNFPILDLEAKIHQTNAVLFLVSNELARELEDGREGKGGAFAAGLVDLCNTTADALTLAFNKSRKAMHPVQADAA